ncbi:hypothetical protein [Burkholderia thailandensis]|uniref:hypothetical protein n=1 Tax=Burkholderia thailandensis TaxID=57975 RepID=UPI00107E8700|nr:hypothetical protein [Burkholderia thailandensis]TGB34383.1 hypothetical protein C6946_07080 [Burkholderia thailandensis]
MNVKPGDLAYIVHADFPELIGLPVEVLAQGGYLDSMWWWRVRASRPVPVWNDRTKRDGMGTEFAVRDDHLRRISGLTVMDMAVEEVAT